MDTKQLEYIIAVEEEKSISRGSGAAVYHSICPESAAEKPGNGTEYQIVCEKQAWYEPDSGGKSLPLRGESHAGR